MDVYSLALIGNASGQDVEGKKLLRGIFDKETRRKAVAVADAAIGAEGEIRPSGTHGMVRK
jgi:hypothetical protein